MKRSLIFLSLSLVLFSFQCASQSPTTKPAPKPSSLTITTTQLPPAKVGVVYNYILKVSGGNPPYVWSWNMPGTVEDIIPGSLYPTIGQTGQVIPSPDIRAKWSGLSLLPKGGIYGRLTVTFNPPFPSNINTYKFGKKDINIKVEDSQGNISSKTFLLDFLWER